MTNHFDLKEENTDKIKFRLTVDNLKNSGDCESKTFDVCRNLRNVYFERGIKYLVVYLRSAVKFKSKDPLFIMASCKLKIISRKYGIERLADYIIPSVFNFNNPKRAFFIKMDQLMDLTKWMVRFHGWISAFLSR